MPRDIERERNRKLYLAGASRKQVMRKHRAPVPKAAIPVVETEKPQSAGGVERMIRANSDRIKAIIAGKKGAHDKVREQAAHDEWQYLNRD